MRLSRLIFQTIVCLSFRLINKKQILATADESIESFNVTEYMYNFLDHVVEPLNGLKDSLDVEDSIGRITKLEKAFVDNFKNLEMALNSQGNSQQQNPDVRDLRSKYLEVSDKLIATLRHKARFNAGYIHDSRYFFGIATNTVKYLNEKSPLLKIHHIIRGDLSSYKPFVIAFIEEYQKSEQVCATGMSPLQAVEIFFRHLKLASAETFAIMSISYEILESLSSKKSGYDLAQQKKFFAYDIVEEYSETFNRYKGYLANVSRAVYACDLENHSGEKYGQIEAFSKVFVEECAGPYRTAAYNTPHRSCQDTSTLSLCCGLRTNEVCSLSRPCKKRLDCKSSTDTTLCLSESPTGQRYESYFSPRHNDSRNCEKRYELKQRYHPETEMEVENRTQCNPMQCTCVEEDYWINLSPSFSRTDDGMVITGAKLVLENNTLSVDIQEGELLLDGTIRDNSTRWWTRPNSWGWTKEKISWTDLRTVELSKTTLKPDAVVTGLGFNIIRNGSENFIRLEVYSSPNSFEPSGLSKVQKLHPVDTHPTKELILVDPEVPTRKIGLESEVTRVRDRKVKFTTTNGKDGGRSTVPFINVQEVTPNLLTPLSGAGLYFFKEHENSGGFIALELFTYNFLPLISGDP
ncbi:hypothetical protein QAD02_008954 [Eretmocerus hayati]|uniref:Uncharacterized protein n=1 Tax=Eretmocerus hayati TaxID=131215 RepID=A0ACC2N822_9HYME|nr:hypothetical protein QAD02_008954 [Eretmocerus hayati]